jgi:hypothetical protein
VTDQPSTSRNPSLSNPNALISASRVRIFRSGQYVEIDGVRYEIGGTPKRVLMAIARRAPRPATVSDISISLRGARAKISRAEVNRDVLDLVATLAEHGVENLIEESPDGWRISAE